MLEKGLLEINDPCPCSVLGRLNRFVVEVEVQGKPKRAYINNTGRLLEFLVRGKKAFCLRNKVSGKTDYRLFALADRDWAAVIDTRLQMVAFERTLEKGLIPWLEGFRTLRRDARLGASLIDYLLSSDAGEAYLEVKSAVLRDGDYAMYPDCPSARGRRHIHELTEYVLGGGKAFLLFIAALAEARAFRPNQRADPELYELLLRAHKAGVNVKAIQIAYSATDSRLYLLNPDLDVNLNFKG